MKVRYMCMKCKECFIVDRSGVLDRDECFKELLTIGHTILFPHFIHHYSSDCGVITFDAYPEKDFDFNIYNSLQKIGIDICYPIIVCRTSIGNEVGFAL